MGSSQLQKNRSLKMVGPLISLGAGSLAGVIGVGAAYPFDSLKVKTQTYAAAKQSTSSPNLSMIEMAREVYKEEGLGGFYSGVFGVMFGQAFIKASLFGSNYWALSVLTNDSSTIPTWVELCLAAAFSGVVSSLLVNPIERIKILMQADKTGRYQSEMDCVTQVLAEDGMLGLLTRGLDGTIYRETPGCTVYFVMYTLLKDSVLTDLIGDFPAAFLSGAAAGVGSWIPIYPTDVVKTNMQNTRGSGNTGKNAGLGFFETALALQQQQGWGVFYEGVQPKLIRAAVSHSVTFAVFNSIVTFIDGQ